MTYLFIYFSYPFHFIEYLFSSFFPETSILTQPSTFHHHRQSDLGFCKSTFTPLSFWNSAQAWFQWSSILSFFILALKLYIFFSWVSSICSSLFVLNSMENDFMENIYIFRFRIHDFNEKKLTREFTNINNLEFWWDTICTY